MLKLFQVKLILSYSNKSKGYFDQWQAFCSLRMFLCPAFFLIFTMGKHPPA